MDKFIFPETWQESTKYQATLDLLEQAKAAPNGAIVQVCLTVRSIENGHDVTRKVDWKKPCKIIEEPD